jgi:hypothetical protein
MNRLKGYHKKTKIDKMKVERIPITTAKVPAPIPGPTYKI